jgi:hypothetical protein
MTTKLPIAAVILVATSWCAPTHAASREIQLRLRYSGSAIATHIDGDHDGVRAGLGTVACKSNLGRCTAQGRAEAAVAGFTTCPNGNPGLQLVVRPGTGHSFIRFDDTGDLLFSEIVAETACHDFATGLLTKSGTAKITGGTGRFAGATGETRFEGTNYLLHNDADGNGFAAQTGTITGTVVLRRD